MTIAKLMLLVDDFLEGHDQYPDQNGHIAERFHIYGHEFRDDPVI